MSLVVEDETEDPPADMCLICGMTTTTPPECDECAAREERRWRK